MSRMPDNNGNRIVIKFVKFFSKMVQLVLLQESDVYTVAEKLPNTIVSQNDLLESNTSNCDYRVFNHYLTMVIPLLDTTLTFSMALHP